ncbi:hypothetical protein A0J57_24235 [Sphingobium sp. 22B]|uniref:hypothetical protein n=1 Tax=unclassified Sphingobium TaxID=2611147 RepID=UPI0007816278|nr:MULTISPECIES: hypothetical protein [unclassified Sphingobium]KXU29303.1 hypothetical protein AXW74_23805 [Sphingobium sp. AM]KYC29756.1 hypothetical protein A0J57_24235 [Sphingobium sp. 22B]OAP29272.1 hypothetical protein A8O16_24625 [Sphingobium sp. 20006FA]
MDLSAAFNAALICIALYVWLQGGWAGKAGALLVMLASVLTYIGMGGHHPFGKPNPLVFSGDLLLLIGFIYLALTSSRWWPIWAAAFQFNGVCSHLVAWAAPKLVSKVYYSMTTAWGIPILIVMAVGVLMDQRASRRLGNGGIQG